MSPVPAKRSRLATSDKVRVTRSTYNPPSEDPANPEPKKNPEVKQPEEVSRKRAFSVLDLLECPVCMETARSGPIFNCTNGHYVCGPCLDRLGPNAPCPICRSAPASVARNKMVETLLAQHLAEAPVECKSSAAGCKVREMVPQLEKHEAVCIFRTVTCPAKLRGTCAWVGPLHQLIKHVISEKCMQIIKIKANSEFSSVIGDFTDKEQTVFTRQTLTHWKPVLLVSQEHIRTFSYLTAYRDSKGEWILSVRSFSAQTAVDKWKVQICIKKSKGEGENGVEEDGDNFSFIGRVIPHDLTEKQVIESGQFLRLCDSQIKQLSRDRTLFEYSVKFLPKK